MARQAVRGQSTTPDGGAGGKRCTVRWLNVSGPVYPDWVSVSAPRGPD